MEAKSFHLGDILSVTTGRLLSTDGIGGVYRILNHMTGDNLFTHQLPRAAQECAPALLEQFPALKEVELLPVMDGTTIPAWLEAQAQKYGAWFDVKPLATFAHQDPVQELVDMVGAERVIQV